MKKKHVKKLVMLLVFAMLYSCVSMAASTGVLAIGNSGDTLSISLAPANGYGTAYKDRFLELWNKIHDPKNGYFSEQGIPYHTPETLICEAPDYGHETTSEAFSYYLWLEAMYGKFTGDWSRYKSAWVTLEKYMIPGAKDQVGMNKYSPLKPATYAPEWETPDKYPAKLEFQSAPSGTDPLFDGLVAAYGTNEIYGMHWILDVDNWYGFGQRGDGVSKPSFFNTFQRGEQESVFETVPQPCWDAMKWGGKNGYLDLFTGDSQYSKQWKYTDAPDADARAIQATFWANQWAKEQGGDVSNYVSKASKMGDYLRYAFFDKYFRQIGTSTKAGTGYDASHYLISWYYAWGGGLDGYWSWIIGSSHIHFGYQNPLTAWILSSQKEFTPKSETGAKDWETSLGRQVEFYQWLQSAEGAIAGGCSNSWNGRYEEIPEGTATFYGMGYQPNPVYHDPGSNTWFGFQAWSMQRVAQYYYETKDTRVKDLLTKWAKWAMSEVHLNADGTFEIPSTLDWEGQPDTWKGTYTGNPNLHVIVKNYGTDLGITGSLANTLLYYSAATGDDSARRIAKELLDRMWILYSDDKGVCVPEKREDYKRFFEGEVFVPEGWSGKMPNGDIIEPGIHFIDIRSKYKQDPDYQKVEEAYKAKTAAEFRYHRFWAQSDIALALGTYAILFGGELPTVSALPDPTPTPTPTATPVVGGLKVQMFNLITTKTSGTIKAKFAITNTGSSDIKLSDVTLKYYFTMDGDSDLVQNFTCDNSTTGGNVTGKFVRISPPINGADNYVEIGFTGAAATLTAGQTVELQIRMNKSDWSMYDQSDDFSFNPSSESYVDWYNLTGYVAGELQWGRDPMKPVVIPTPSPSPKVTPSPTQTGVQVNSPTPNPTIEPEYEFKVDPVFEPSKLAANQMMTVRVTASNVSALPYDGKKDVLLIVALYDRNNTMVNVSYISKGIPYMGTETLSAGFKLPKDVTGYTVRAFMWDGSSLSDTNMIPISNEAHIPN